MNKFKTLALLGTLSMAFFACSGEDGATGAKGEKGEAGVDGKDGVGCTLSDTTSKSGLEGVVITCGDDVRIVWNGTDGKDGEDGNDGKDGEDGNDGKDGEKGKTGAKGDQGDKGDNGKSCTVKDTTDADKLSGIVLSCEDGSHEVIWNGVKGDKGENGTSCKTVVHETWVGQYTYVKCSDTDSALVASKDEYAGISVCSEYTSKSNWNLMKADADYGCLKDERDEQVYRAVKIGTQVWMAENLNFRYVNDEGTDSTSWCYNGDKNNCEIYGRLYSWDAAKQTCPTGWHLPNDTEWNALWDAVEGTGLIKDKHRGICPEGWHLPNDDEWNTLFSAVGGTSTAGTKLKSTSGWSNGGNGTDSYGFSVLPAGGVGIDGDYDDAGYYARFWSSSEVDSIDAYYWFFDYDYGGVDQYDVNKDHWFSVRCIKDSL
ncbi:MAG: hypothetical protein HUK21_06735 [Fibrobacteraceae bacterium]|nr:hypothetical protein [Fibrobacteraceae bacterium]